MHKIPIQRLQQRVRDEGKGRRTSRACDLCRQRKTKCDGNKPTCAQCRALGVSECVYSENKVAMDQKHLASARSKLEVYERLLRDISRVVDGRISKKIAAVLKEPFAKGRERRESFSSASSSSAGSLDGVDTVSEDLNRNEETRATGYMGKNSEVSWMQSLDSETAEQDGKLGTSGNNAQPQRLRGGSVASMSYHLDFQHLSEPDVGSAFELPSKALADRLINIYFNRVYDSVPIVRRDLFSEQYRRVFSPEAVDPGRKWLAVLNMIFAISSEFCQTSKQDVHNDTFSDVFFARAKSLSMSENVVYEHEDLQQVQAEALMAFYFLTISQINRSWKMVGIAARAGITLGLNLRQTNNDIDISSDEARKLLWWSIVYIEHLLSVMTGRVSCLANGSSTAPPPLPFESSEYSTPHISKSKPQAYDIQWTLYQRGEHLDLATTRE